MTLPTPFDESSSNFIFSHLLGFIQLDPSKLVRQRGSAALGKLMALNARVDPLLVELAVCTTQADGPAIKASTLEVR
jgi:hypothetical protein